MTAETAIGFEQSAENSIKEAVTPNGLEDKKSDVENKELEEIDQVAKQLQKPVLDIKERENLFGVLCLKLKSRIEGVMGGFYKLHGGQIRGNKKLDSEWNNECEGLKDTAFIVIAKALKDWNRGKREEQNQESASFSTYFCKCFDNYLKSRWLQFHTTQGRTGIEESMTGFEKGSKEYQGQSDILDKKTMDSEEDIVNSIAARELKDRLKDVVSKSVVDARVVLVLALRFGLGKQWLGENLLRVQDKKSDKYIKAQEILNSDIDMEDEKTLGDLSEMLGVTKQCVHSIEKRALEKIRKELEK